VVLKPLAEGMATAAQAAATSAAAQPKADDFTIALIKPDAVQHYTEIKDIIQRNMFTILKEKKLVLTKEQTQVFYQEHATKPFFPNLVAYMSR
jgi:nucleoside-diphosphate kinase